MGLTPYEHGELNNILFKKPMEECRLRYAELRNKYASDSEALQWIDMYDPESDYHIHFEIIRDALFRGGNKEDARMEFAFIKEHYPYLCKKEKTGELENILQG